MGVILGLGSLSIALNATLGSTTREATAYAICLFLIALIVASSGIWWGTDKNRLMRKFGINLIARPGVNDDSLESNGSEMKSLDERASQVILMAHLDSKSQPIPMITRVIGISGSIVIWLGVCLLFILDFEIGLYDWGWVAFLYAVAISGFLFALPVALCTIGSHGTGALDNGTGVAVVVDAAARLAKENVPVTVILTSAEELGLAGARSLVPFIREMSVNGPIRVLNCDSIDDVGEFVVMTSRPPNLDKTAACLVEAASLVSSPPPMRISVRKMLTGVLTDSVVLSTAGIDAITLSKGNWKTLGRIHTHKDTLKQIDGSSLLDASALLTEAAKLVRKRVSIVQ